MSTIIEIDFPWNAHRLCAEFAARVSQMGLDPYRFDDVPRIIDMAQKELLPQLPSDFIEKLRQTYEARHLMVIHNSPVDKVLPNVPNDPRPHDKKSRLSEVTWLAITAALNMKPGIDGSTGLELLEQVVPLDNVKEDQRSFASSEVPFYWHNDGAFHCRVPDMSTLYFLRGQGEAENRFIRIESILRRLDDETLNALRRPHFKTWHPISDGDHKGMYPMLEAAEDGLVLRWGNVRATTPEAKVAKQKVREAITNIEAEGEYVSFYGHSGDLVILPNRAFLHNRSTFRDVESQGHRWVQMGVLHKTDPVDFGNELNQPQVAVSY